MIKNPSKDNLRDVMPIGIYTRMQAIYDVYRSHTAVIKWNNKFRQGRESGPPSVLQHWLKM